jgi:hypothetical protein
MIPRGRTRHAGTYVAGLVIAATFIVSFRPLQRETSTGLTGEDILWKVFSRLDAVEDYTVTVDIIADIERLNVPPMQATLYFKQPDKVHVDAKGFALLPRDGLAFNLRKLLDKYSVASVAGDTSGGVLNYCLTLVGKSARTLLKDIELTVRADRWTVEKLTTPQAGNREMTAKFSYTSVEGFWLPSTMVASFAVPPAEGDEETPYSTPEGQRRQPRFHNGTITVKYSAYKVNTGLSDDMFRQDSLRQAQ